MIRAASAAVEPAVEAIARTGDYPRWARGQVPSRGSSGCFREMPEALSAASEPACFECWQRMSGERIRCGQTSTARAAGSAPSAGSWRPIRAQSSAPRPRNTSCHTTRLPWNSLALQLAASRCASGPRRRLETRVSPAYQVADAQPRSAQCRDHQERLKDPDQRDRLREQPRSRVPSTVEEILLDVVQY